VGQSGMRTRREFVVMATALGLCPSLHGMDRKAQAPAKVKVDGPDSLRAHAATVGLQVGCAVVPQLLEMDADSSSGSLIGSQDPYTRTVIGEAVFWWRKMP
jgi:hypothetical protein